MSINFRKLLAAPFVKKWLPWALVAVAIAVAIVILL